MAKPLKKKEKAALKNKELDNLDSLLRELGVEGEEKIGNGDDAKEEPKSTEVTDSKSSGKKNKLKKKENNTSINATATKTEETAEVKDVIAGLKETSKSLKKLSGAAAAAVKEAKAKLAAAGKKKEQKK